MSSLAQPDIQSALNAVVFDPKAHASVNYAKARLAIEPVAKNRAEKRRAKMIVVEHFGGKVVHADPDPKKPRLKASIFVEFPDNSRAIF